MAIPQFPPGHAPRPGEQSTQDCVPHKGGPRATWGSAPPLQQHQEKHRESGCTPSRLISRANKGKSRHRGTKPHPWNVGRSGKGAEVTPLPAGNSIPCCSPVWDLPFFFYLIPSQLPSPGSWQTSRRLGEHLPGEKYHRRNSYTGVNLIKPPPIVYFNIALVTEIIKMDSVAKLISFFPF